MVGRLAFLLGQGGVGLVESAGKDMRGRGVEESTVHSGENGEVWGYSEGNVKHKD